MLLFTFTICFLLGNALRNGEYFKTQYTRFKRLNKLVSTQYKGICKIIFVSLQLIAKSWWLNFLQYINNSVRQVDDNTYELTYTIGGKMYKMFIKPKKGPSPVLMATTENNEIVTHRIVPHIGPHRDFHGTSITPKCFGWKQITLELSDGQTKIFEEEEELNFYD